VPPTSCNDECPRARDKGKKKRLLCVNMTNRLRPHRLQDGSSSSSRTIISCEAIARKLLTISSSCCLLSLHYPLTVTAVTRYVSIMVVAIVNFRHGHVAVVAVVVVAVDDLFVRVDLGTESTWAGA
jgi:hypothetical protein